MLLGENWLKNGFLEQKKNLPLFSNHHNGD